MPIAQIIRSDTIAHLHQQRTQDIHSVLGATSRTGPSARTSSRLSYALAHHFLEGATAAAQRRDHDSFHWYKTGPDRDLTHLTVRTTVGDTMVLTPEPHQLLWSAVSETPYYLIDPNSHDARIELKRLLSHAVKHCVDTGFGTLIATQAPIVCLLRRRSLSQTLHSWSITRLPGTVFTEHADDAWVLGRDLVHEASHNWLNDALKATTTVIPDDVTFYSPWRGTPRPVFGFIHACWAFSMTMLYTTKALPNIETTETREFLVQYLTQQRALLAQAYDDAECALTYLTDTDLQSRVHAVITEAAAPGAENERR